MDNSKVWCDEDPMKHDPHYTRNDCPKGRERTYLLMQMPLKKCFSIIRKLWTSSWLFTTNSRLVPMVLRSRNSGPKWYATLRASSGSTPGGKGGGGAAGGRKDKSLAALVPVQVSFKMTNSEYNSGFSTVRPNETRTTIMGTCS